MRRALVVIVIALLAGVLQVRSAAHEIPQSVAVHAFVKPEGQRLHVLVRVPLGAMRDIQFPEREGFLVLSQIEPDLYDAVRMWIVPELRLFEEQHELTRPVVDAVRLSLPSDRSLMSFEEAIAHVKGPPLSPSAQLPRDQALLDVLLEYRISTPDSSFAIHPAFSRLGVNVSTTLRFVGPAGLRAFQVHGDPGIVRFDPRWHQAAWHFVRLGFAHILDGVDHLLFLACLVIPLRRLRPLALVVTAFTAAHSITLGASALGLAPDALWFPPLVETLIAASIVYMAIENVVSTPSVARRCALAFGFGLVHGFGFSFALTETLQFAGSHLLMSLLSFNAGVEAGQLVAIAVLVPALQLLFRFVISERMGTVVLSVIVGHTAWHWMTDRWNALSEFEGPSPDGLFVTRMLIVVTGVSLIFWIAKSLASPRGVALPSSSSSSASSSVSPSGLPDASQ
jgi:hypothetical protein